MRRLLDLLGAPDRRMQIVLIAGTKGKGSTAAMLASILHAAGFRAGLFTSPHLQRFRERVRIDGAMLTPGHFAQAVAALRPAVAALRRRAPEAGEPTTFELTLALALSEFARAGCVVAVLEVGLGGALDATNAVEPAVSVVTSISYDHTAILGRSLPAIATEKAGILRPDRPAFFALQRPVAARALRSSCRRIEAACQFVDPLPAGWTIGLPGAHQRQNAALAIGAAAALGRGGLAVRSAAYARGLRNVVWPGRFEIVSGAPPIVLDGAHNGASADALARELARRFGRRPLLLIIGINRDKDARAVLRPLLRRATAVVATAAPVPRALEPQMLAALCRTLTDVSVLAAADVRRALARRSLLARNGVLCVTGSLALVGAARDALRLPPRERWW
jgi:dihydrofolate synthase/folylpolyglutamate synthase